MAATIYYFDGSGSCDLCASATGYSVGAEPARPHPYCDCSIETIDPAEFEDCAYELRNLRVDESIDTYEVRRHLDRCDEPDEEVGTADIIGREEAHFDEGLEEYARAEGWRPPELGVVTAEFVLWAGAEGDLVFPIEHYTARLEAEVWLVCNVDGVIVEEQVGLATGDYRRNFEVGEPEIDWRLCRRYGDRPV